MGTLRVVATPIGNLDDITLRALRVLGEADLILAEDTRRTRILLQRHGIAGRLRSLHAHNEVARAGEVLAALQEGRSVVLVADAGTPLVSDPGERLVAAVLRGGHRVEAVPGPSAVLAALTVAGLATVPFTFLGFPPRRATARRSLFAHQRGRTETLVLFESPRRLGATLHELAETLGERSACVARELTKRHEEVARGTLDELAQRFAGGARGEVTLVVAGAEPAEQRPRLSPADRLAVDACIRALLAEGRSAREISTLLAAELPLSRRQLYARCVAARQGQ